VPSHRKAAALIGATESVSQYPLSNLLRTTATLHDTSIRRRLEGPQLQTNDRLLSSTEALDYLADAGIRRSPVTLGRWSAAGTGPAFRRLGRFRLYAVSDINDWIQAQLSPRQQSIRQPIKRTPQPAAGRTL
jgi:hypothetical protein